MDPKKPSPMFRAIVVAGVALTACGSESVTGSDASADGSSTSDGSTGDATSDAVAMGDVGATETGTTDSGADSGEPTDARDDFPLIR